MELSSVRAFGLFVAILVSAYSAFGSEPSPELLKKIANKQTEVTEVFRSGSFTLNSKTEELDGAGQLVASHEYTVRLSHKDGHRIEDLLRAVEDGKDVTEKQRQDRLKHPPDERDRKDPWMRPEDTPFTGDSQPKYRFNVVGMSTPAAGQVKIAFAPRAGVTENSLKGEALVDSSSGELLFMRCEPTPLPMFAEHVVMQLEYNSQTPSGRTLSRMKIDGSGGVLFIRRSVRATILFTDFQPRTQ